jgi:hypothetical protein
MNENKRDTAKLSPDLLKEVRHFVAENGGSIRKVLECGALWVMSKGAKEYISKLKK